MMESASEEDVSMESAALSSFVAQTERIDALFGDEDDLFPVCSS
jgi:hypothetical protein